MSSKIGIQDTLKEILSRKIEEFMSSEKEEHCFTVKLEGNEGGDDLMISVLAEKLEDDYDQIDEVMPVDEFTRVQCELIDLMIENEVPIVSMIMLFANRLAFASRDTEIIDRKQLQLAFLEAYSMFSLLNNEKEVGKYEYIVDKVYQELAREID